MLARRIPDRNLPFPVWVEHEIDGHVHLIVCADNILPEDMHLVMAGIEGYGEELADIVGECNEDRHDGHGRTHSYDDMKAAYSSAVNQLLTRDFQAEWEEIQRKIRVYKKWGGQVPAFILQPTTENAKLWEAIIPDSEGNPYVYGVRKNVLEDWNPIEFGAKPNPLGGWTLPRGRN